MKKVKRRWHAPDPTRYVLDGDEPDLEVFEDRQGDVKERRGRRKGLVVEEQKSSKSKGIVNKRDPEREKKLERMLKGSLQQRSNVTVESQPAARDIWGDTSSTASRKKPFQKESKLPAQAVLPKHGISYRPDSQAHMDQVAVATAFELQKKAERERWEKALQVPDEIRQLPDDDDDKTLNHYTNFLMGKPVDPAQVRRQQENQTTNNLTPCQQFSSGVDDEDDNDDDDDDDGEALPRKKKQTGLNKQYRKKMKKLRKGRIGREIDAVRSITRKILEEDAERKLKWKLRVKRKLQKAHFGAQRVGKRRFQEHRPPVVLSDDLPHSLRTVSSDAPLAGNLVVDTFRHLQRRNMIPTTVHHKFQSRHAVHRFVRPTDRRQWEAILETKFGIVESELAKQSRRQKPKKSSRKPKDDIDRILEADQERDEFL